MDIYVLDTFFKPIMLIDQFTSFIWTDRYDQCGDFELTMPADRSILDIVKQDHYLRIGASEHMMIIEGIDVDTDAENGVTMMFRGRSLESILDRRIVWVQTNLNSAVNVAVQRLLNEAIINPSNGDRRIDNFIYSDTTDPQITGTTIEAQFTGDNLYDVIQALCIKSKCGFKVVLDDQNRFVLSLYAGADRSRYVIFSPDFDNLINSNYTSSNSDYKNVTLVAGEGEGSERKTTTVGSASGLSRKELYTDARDISSQTDGGTMTDSEYTQKLKERGEEKLKERKNVDAFEGECDYESTFILGRDYDIGDVVAVSDAYGHENMCRITEIVIAEDETGYSMYPTFEKEEEETDAQSSI